MKINAIFLDLPYTENATLEQYRDYFFNYSQHTDKWEYINSGRFGYKDDQREVFLFFINNLGKRISLRYDDTITDNPPTRSYYSVGNINDINNFVDAGTDEFIPSGSYLTIQEAWDVIVDFLRTL